MKITQENKKNVFSNCLSNENGTTAKHSRTCGWSNVPVLSDSYITAFSPFNSIRVGSNGAFDTLLLTSNVNSFPLTSKAEYLKHCCGELIFSNSVRLDRSTSQKRDFSTLRFLSWPLTL